MSGYLVAPRLESLDNLLNCASHRRMRVNNPIASQHPEGQPLVGSSRQCVVEFSLGPGNGGHFGIIFPRGLRQQTTRHEGKILDIVTHHPNDGVVEILTFHL